MNSNLILRSRAPSRGVSKDGNSAVPDGSRRAPDSAARCRNALLTMRQRGVPLSSDESLKLSSAGGFLKPVRAFVRIF